MYGINLFLQDCVQSVLNAAARMIAGVSKFDSISSYMRDELHWLRFPFRVKLKIALLVRDCLIGDAPAYLIEQLMPVSRVHGRCHLRSSDHGDLVMPSFRSSTFGRRRFSVVAAEIWNSLPVQLKDGSITDRQLFKKSLKHHYFNIVHHRKRF